MKNKVIKSILLIVVFFSIALITNISKGYEFTSGDIKYYDIGDNEVRITNYTGSSSTLTIPSTVNGYKVKEIDYEAFEYSTNLSKVVIPTSIDYIDSYAFYGCSNLREVKICNPECYISYSVFSGCSDSLKLLGNSNSKVEEYAQDYGYRFEVSHTHFHITKTSNYKQASMIENGLNEYYCKDCGQTISNVINKISSVALKTTSYTYSGSVKTPGIVVKDSMGKTLSKDTDYTVSYAGGRKNVRNL